MVKTIVLDGVEYLLIPLDEVKKDENPVPEPSQDAFLEDFLGTELSPYHLPSEETSNQQETSNFDTVKLVDATENIDAPKAVPQEYEYRKRYLKHQLRVSDITAQKIPPHFENYEDIPEIEANMVRNIKTAKAGFYGPGVEYDISR